MPRSSPPSRTDLYRRYQELRSYVNLVDENVQLAVAVWPLIEPSVDLLVDDFYKEILRHEEAKSVFGGPEQVQRLKASLRDWIAELFAGNYDQEFVARRWQVGFRHVQIGLQPVWVSAAMSRLREHTLSVISARWSDSAGDLEKTRSTVARMMDLDLALIQDAYNTESVARHLNIERDFAEGVIQTAQAVVMVVDLTGNIIRGNAFLSSLLGWQSDRPMQKQNTLNELVAPNDCRTMLEFLQRTADGDSPSALETELYPQNGPPRRIRWLARRFLAVPEIVQSTSPQMSEAPTLVLCVGQDITDLTEAQRQLVSQERLAAIGQTMTGLAHESRNAFQRSQAALETLLLELEDRPAAVQLIERIQRAHDHLLHLYEEVLQFARPIRLELQQVHPDLLLRQTWDHVSASAQSKKVTLNYDLNSELPQLTCDPFAIEQILRNLLENAIEASETSSSVLATIRTAWLGSAPAVELSIRDYGKGIPEAYVHRVFEPFFTTRSRGTGLGLSIARRLAEGHGGSLALANAHPGTLATLTLPLVASPTAEPHLPNEDTRRT
jgi:signal transduction histidine kinase